MRTSLVVVCLVALAFSGASCGKKMKMPEVRMPKIKLPEGPTAEERIDRQLGVVIRAADEEGFYREIGELVGLAQKVGWDRRQLMMRMIAYAQSVPEADQGRYLQLLDTVRIPKPMLVDAAAVQLEQTGADEAVCRMLLRTAAYPGPTGPADYSHFLQYLTTHRNQPPAKLIRWMYERDPAAAMEALAAVNQGEMSEQELRDARIGARVLDQLAWKQSHGLAQVGEVDALAAEQLEKLSRFKQWYVRLYAAEMAVRHPQLRTAALEERLGKDENALVAGRMAGR